MKQNYYWLKSKETGTKIPALRLNDGQWLQMGSDDLSTDEWIRESYLIGPIAEEPCFEGVEDC